LEVTTLANIKTENKEAPPPPKEDAPPPAPKVKFTPPVIAKDEDVKEEDMPPAQEEINKSTTPIGNYNDTATVVKAVEKPKVIQEEEEPPAQVIVEQMPEFPGGEEELLKYLAQHIKYPQIAKETGITGTVYITFVISSKGKVKDVKVLRGIGGGCDEEAVRVVQSMPDWKPGRQNSQNVPVQFNLPVKFVLQ
jgi:protein TonB